MVNYARAAANAKEKIEANGRSVTLQADATAPSDANQPYYGPDFSGGPAPEVVIALFLPAIGTGFSSMAALLLPTMKSYEQVAMIAATSVTGDIQTFDRLVDDSVVWSIAKVGEFAPGGTDIFYQLGLERR